MKIHALVLAVLLVAAPAFAADVDGKWTGNFSTPQGDVPVGFEFKADGAMLTGSSTGPDGTVTPIKDGKVEGNTITFVLEVDAGGMPLVMNFTGMVAAAQGQIALTADIFGMPIEIVVKKDQ